MATATVFIGATPAFATNVIYNSVLRNGTSHLCMAVAGGSTANNAAIVQFTCDGQSRSNWTIYESPDFPRNYYITNMNSHKCLSPAGGSPSTYAPIVQYDCDTDISRLWRVIGVGATYFELQNVHSKWCISTDGDSRKINAPLIQYNCDAQLSRQWGPRTP